MFLVAAVPAQPHVHPVGHQHHRLLLPLREQRDLVVDVLKDDEDGRLTRQLLGPVVLHADRQVVLLDPLEVERLVDLDICVRPSVVLALLQVEGVVLVGLVGGAADELVEYGGVVLNTRTGEDRASATGMAVETHCSTPKV